MIDKQPFGGTCALRGCDPKKVLVGATAAIEAVRGLVGKGLRPAGLAIDWAELMAFKRTFTDPYSERKEAGLAKAGIELFHGEARFTGASSVAVGDAVLEASRAVVIAAGDRPADLPIAGREHLCISDRFLELSVLPGSIAFVGGGYISFEFAHVAARAGARVTILHRGARPLVGFDPDLVVRLVARTRALGVDVRLGTEVRGIEAVGAAYRVSVSDGPPVDADLVVHGAGRVPDLDGLDLAVAGVRATRGGVEVNEFLQSVSNPKVYAAGDCAATKGPPLTPVAGYEGGIVATNMLEGHQATADYAAIPSVAFTLPPLATVGLSEDEARAQGLRFAVKHQDTAGWYSSRRLGEEASAFKVLVEETTGRILGAHLLGPHAEETINLFALAMKAGMNAEAFKRVIWAYPTNASDTAYMV